MSENVSIVPGSGRVVDHEDEPNTEYYAATLWLPDPDTRRGWARHEVEWQKPKSRKPIGLKPT